MSDSLCYNLSSRRRTQVQHKNIHHVHRTRQHTACAPCHGITNGQLCRLKAYRLHAYPCALRKNRLNAYAHVAAQGIHSDTARGNALHIAARRNRRQALKFEERSSTPTQVPRHSKGWKAINARSQAADTANSTWQPSSAATPAPESSGQYASAAVPATAFSPASMAR
eukprot:scpid51623/ scgid11016/ 